MRKVALALMVSGALLVQAGAARAQGEAEAAPPVVHKHLGVGFKIGNGMGFVGGDILISPIPHLTLDLQASYLSTGVNGGGTASGYGLAPTIQGHLFSGQRSSPYVGVGLLYATLTLDNVTASASGVVGNIGYEWRWTSGLGILLGAGLGHLGTIHATDGVTTIDSPGSTHFNIEAGLRYMFL
jgi:hypothetical protein